MRSKESSDAGGGALTETRAAVTAPQPGEVPASSAPALVAAAYQDAAGIANAYHKLALLWANGVDGLEQHVGETDSSRIATDILARIPPDAQAALDRIVSEAVAARDAEIARMEGLLRERLEMLERYNAMLKETAIREEFWKAKYAALQEPKP